jgi:FkbM family methyltransferase
MLKEFIRKLARMFDHEIQGLPRAYAAERTLAGLLREHRINLVLDVGANTGQFVDELLASGYKGRIVSFEPLNSAHQQLCEKSQLHANWTVADRTAIGAVNGSIDINLSGNGVSSSILGMLPAHSKAAPESGYVGTESVPIRRLDDLYSLTSEDRALLKIDVQGYEKQVIDGAATVLTGVCAVMTEMSLVPLYEGQMLGLELWNLLATKGFEPWSFEPGFRDPITGRTLQVDGLFVRPFKTS